MFIFVTYRDAPELSSSIHHRLSETLDSSAEKTLLVNPNCPVRIMLEYIRKKCRLGIFTQFDLCEEDGSLMNLFSMNTYAYATDQFEHKKTYYLIVIKLDSGGRYKALPQLNHESKLYGELQSKINRYLVMREFSSLQATSITSAPSTPIKPSVLYKPSSSKKKLK